MREGWPRGKGAEGWKGGEQQECGKDFSVSVTFDPLIKKNRKKEKGQGGESGRGMQ
jgi:hypothetical protein